MKLCHMGIATIALALSVLATSGVSAEAKMLCKSESYYRELIKKQCERRCEDVYGEAVKNQKLQDGGGLGLAAGTCFAACPIKAKLTSRWTIHKRYASNACTR